MQRERRKKEKSEQKLNMGKSGRWLRITIVSLACVILAGISFNVYSKYYKTGHNKGVSVASGFYFASNYMAELEKEDQSVAHVADLKTMTERLRVKASDNPWDTPGEVDGKMITKSTISVDMNNFSNQLLYNDKDLDVEYTVEFILLEEPENVAYQIRKSVGVGAPTGYQPLTAASGVSYAGGMLEGGKLSTETYEIEVAIQDLTGSYTPASILALAYPTKPSYVVENRKIAGIITADFTESELTITDQGFVIEKDLEKSTTWKADLLEQSGLEYQIRTTGSYAGDGETGIKKKLVLTWDANMYILDNENQYKKELKEKYKGDPDGLAKYLNEEGDEEGHGWMKVDILPYSSIKFRFYLVPDSGSGGFEKRVVDLTSLEEFKETVNATIE